MAMLGLRASVLMLLIIITGLSKRSATSEGAIVDVNS